jgi:hypothetical protein
MVTSLRVSGLIVKQNIMVTYRRGYLAHTEQEAEREEGTGAQI